METTMIGNKITEARKKANMSQADLANQLFISPQAVGKWERSESIPDFIMVSKLAEILGVDLNYFSNNLQQSLANTNTEIKNPQAPEAKKPNWDILHRLSNLPPKQIL